MGRNRLPLARPHSAAAGAGVEGVGVFVVPASGGDRTELATTDAQGRIRADLGAERVAAVVDEILEPAAARTMIVEQLEAWSP